MLCRGNFGQPRAQTHVYVLALVCQAISRELDLKATAEQSFELRHLLSAQAAHRVNNLAADGVVEVDVKHVDTGAMQDEQPDICLRDSEHAWIRPRLPLGQLEAQGRARAGRGNGNTQAGHGTSHSTSHGSSQASADSPADNLTAELANLLDLPSSSRSSSNSSPSEHMLVSELTVAAHNKLKAMPESVLHKLLQLDGRDFMQVAPGLAAVQQVNQHRAQVTEAAQQALAPAIQLFNSTTVWQDEPEHLEQPLQSSDGSQSELGNLLHLVAKLLAFLQAMTSAVAASAPLQAYGSQLQEYQQALGACHKKLQQQHGDLMSAGTSDQFAVRTKKHEVQGNVLELQRQLRSVHHTLSIAAQLPGFSSLDVKSAPDTLLQHNMAAADVEKLSCNRNWETHPHYVNHAVAGRDPVILVAMLGYATSQLMKAYKVTNVLDMEAQALDSSLTSEQLNKSARGVGINSAVFRVVHSSDAEEVPTVHAAFTETTKALGDKLVATYSTGAFDERHLFRDLLLAKEGLCGGAVCRHPDLPALDAICATAQELEDENECPAFLDAYPVFNQLFQILFILLENDPATTELIQSAKSSGVKQLSLRLNRVLEVFDCCPERESICICCNALRATLSRP